MTFRSQLFEAMAVAFPDAIIRYEHCGDATFMAVTQFIEDRQNSLSVAISVPDVEVRSVRDHSILIEAYVRNARAHWDEELANARAAA